MDASSPSRPDSGSNPFATRFIRPGAIPFLFPAGITVDSLLAQLRRQNWRAAIIGPHGSGKSSLLATLKPELELHGRAIVAMQLHGGQRALDWRELDYSSWTDSTLVIVDGYEQLSRWQRLLIRARTYQRRAGLLVTAHEPVGIPAIFTTRPTAELARQIVAQLVPPDEAQRILPADIDRAFAAERGNVREMLLRLYDVFRDRR